MDGARALATRLRRRIHLSVAKNDLDMLCDAIDQLYDDESPLRHTGEVKSLANYAPMVEAYILARLHSPEDSAIRRETHLNLLHTHAAFGMSRGDYETILRQCDTITDAASDEWCKGTGLEGLVKPQRHARLFVD